MSQAFVKEQDGEWLSEVAPNIAALTRFLIRENNGRTVTTKSTSEDKAGRTIYAMSNGLSYMIDEDNRWQVVF